MKNHNLFRSRETNIINFPESITQFQQLSINDQFFSSITYSLSSPNLHWIILKQISDINFIWSVNILVDISKR